MSILVLKFGGTSVATTDLIKSAANVIKKEYELGRQRGETRTMWNSFIENPVRFVLYLALIGGVLFLSLQVFLSF